MKTGLRTWWHVSVHTLTEMTNCADSELSNWGKSHLSNPTIASRFACSSLSSRCSCAAANITERQYSNQKPSHKDTQKVHKLSWDLRYSAINNIWTSRIFSTRLCHNIALCAPHQTHSAYDKMTERSALNPKERPKRVPGVVEYKWIRSLKHPTNYRPHKSGF
jgi:hypothetical protein